MAEVYFRDTTLQINNNGPRRLKADYASQLATILPIKPSNETITKLGFIATYTNDSDANFVFNGAVQAKLLEINLTTRFSPATSVQREVFIINIPAQIYSKTDDEIKADIVNKARIPILNSQKFTGLTGKKYIKITVDSKSSRDIIVSSGRIILFDTQLTTEGKIPKNTQNSNVGRPPTTHQFTPSIPTSQNQGPALPSSSDWAGPQRPHHTQPWTDQRSQHNRPPTPTVYHHHQRPQP